MDIFKIAMIGGSLTTEQKKSLESFSKNSSTNRNIIDFVDISAMSEDQILAEGAFNGVFFNSKIHNQEQNNLLNDLLSSQLSPDDLSYFIISDEPVTDKTMEEENSIIASYLGSPTSTPVFPVKVTNENELNAYLQGIVSTTTIAYFNEINPLTDKTANKMNFINQVMSSIEGKHDYTAGHVERVSRYVEQLAKEMNFSEHEQNEVVLAAKLHDIGKIGIPDEVLASTKALNYTERTQMNYHSQLGDAILKSSISRNAELQQSITPAVLEGIRNHHKDYNGFHDKQHQDPINGEAIGKYGLTIAVADCIDAMTSQRAYNNPKHVLDTLRDLWFQKGKQFSPQVAEAGILMLGKQIAELGIDPNQMFSEPYNNPKNAEIDENLKEFFQVHSNEIQVNPSPELNQYSSLGFKLNEYGYFEFQGKNSPKWNPQIRVEDEYLFQEGKYARDNGIPIDRISSEQTASIMSKVKAKFEAQDREGQLALNRSRVRIQTRELSGEIEKAMSEDFDYNNENYSNVTEHTINDYKKQQNNLELESKDDIEQTK